ncbi:MAG: tetratricopeptide repeat protein [Gemmatimonadales bacterium]|nr:tetratricopeptide repeat protein [Gemmatimonadales bacterium]
MAENGRGAGCLTPHSIAESLLTLRLLGELELAGRGEAPVTALLVQPKRLALLVYLAVALPRGFRRRDEILALFWPESDADHARNSLRQSLHGLRNHLPAGVLLTRGSEEVGLCRDLLRVDVHSFEDLLDSGREAEGLALYQGELLPGFHVPGSPDFEVWLEAERERLRRRAVRAALVLARRLEMDGDATRAAEWARFAEERAPFDEAVLREVLELLTDLGDRAGAVQLCEAAAGRFRRELGIELSPQTEQIGRAIAAGRQSREFPAAPHRGPGATVTLRSPLRRKVPAPARQRPVSAEARHLYLQARHASGQRSPVTIRRALELFEQALRLCPDYAEAHSGLALALTQATVYVAYPPIQALPRVKAHALKAIRLDPSLGEAHAMLAQATLWYDYDWAPAEEIYLRALEADPTSEAMCCSYALYYLTPMGRLDEALVVLDRARDSMPMLLGISTFCGMACAFGRRFERAKREAESVITMEPGFVQAHWVRGMALEGLGDFDAAIETFERGASLTNGSSLMLSQLGRARARAGDHTGAEEILSELDRRGETTGPAAYFTAEILAALGLREAALERLYAAYRERNPLLVFAGILSGLDPLRGERRFSELLMRIGLRAHERVA